jgi:hypothetical protein
MPERKERLKLEENSLTVVQCCFGEKRKKKKRAAMRGDRGVEFIGTSRRGANVSKGDGGVLCFAAAAAATERLLQGTVFPFFLFFLGDGPGL